MKPSWPVQWRRETNRCCDENRCRRGRCNRSLDVNVETNLSLPTKLQFTTTTLKWWQFNYFNVLLLSNCRNNTCKCFYCLVDTTNKPSYFDCLNWHISKAWLIALISMMLQLLLLLLPVIFGSVTNAGTLRAAADRRCLDPPALNATLLKNCQAIGGYSWDGVECTYQDNAGCSKTRNKFKEKDKCLKSECFLMGKNIW